VRKRFRVYVDESGGRHVTKKSDKHFVISAVVVVDDYDARVRAEFRDLKVALGRKPGDVLHFRSLSKPQRLQAAEGVAALPIAMVTNVIVVKDELKKRSATGEMERAFIARPDPLYLWALRLLVERVSIFANKRGATDVTATFSHVQGLNPPKLYEYERRLRQLPGVSINWELFRTGLRVGSPRRVELLQLADTTASATYHAVDGLRRDDWLRAMSPKLFRGRGPITSYGLKVFPPKEAEPGGSLYWLRSF
jgi:hypothetical protein